jgi:hypothetical protein
LAGQHGDLTAVVSIVRDQIGEESGNIRAKAFDAAAGFQRLAHDGGEPATAGFQGAHSLHGRHRSAVELLRNFVRLRRFQPHYAHIVHVGDDGRDGAAFAVGRFCLPGFWRKILDQVAIDAVIGGKSVEQSG